MIRYATRLPPGKPVELVNDTTIRKTYRWSLEYSFRFMDKLIKHFINHPDPLVVPISNYKVICANSYDYQYSYDMDRLGLLSKEERQLVNDCGDASDHYGCHFWHKMPESLRQKFNDHPKLSAFMQTISSQGRYHDLHSGNVMMNMDDEYMLIDIEGFLNLPLESPDNDWIT
jgi:hypothetical protein